jgi:hypothetical protein
MVCFGSHQFGAIPVLLQNAPATLNRIVLAMVDAETLDLLTVHGILAFQGGLSFSLMLAKLVLSLVEGMVSVSGSFFCGLESSSFCS